MFEFERPNNGGEGAILVHIDITGAFEKEDPGEFMQLATSAGADPLQFISGQRSAPQSRYYCGTGKLEEIKAAVHEQCAEVVLFNNALSPSQERNLEQALECRVLDRTGLILDIFAQRARTHEGKLQVELAQLEHLSTRLVRGWTHLERQKGGIGMRGPGETQLETDRRLLRARIKNISARLEKVRKQRDQARRSRSRAEIASVSLVGYTNAGKSTLFNQLTGSGVYAADQLFATLDPTLRTLALPDIGEIILADTVGFIRHLPHRLVEAFRATLEEAANADFLLHLIDAADEERQENYHQVQEVLQEIGADNIQTLEVYNKIDLLGMQPKIERDGEGKPIRVWLSAQANQGLELLKQALTELLSDDIVEQGIRLLASQGRIRSRLYAMDVVKDERPQDDGSSLLKIRMQKIELERLLSQERVSLEELLWLEPSED